MTIFLIPIERIVVFRRKGSPPVRFIRQGVGSREEGGGSRQATAAKPMMSNQFLYNHKPMLILSPRMLRRIVTR